MESTLLNRPASPADSLRSLPVVCPEDCSSAGHDLSRNREACVAVCVVDRCSASRRETFYYHLGTAPMEEAMRIAERVTVTDSFVKELFSSGSQPTDLATIATPTWGVFDEEDEEIVYEAFTMEEVAGSGEKSMYVKFPRADGWLRHDFTQAIVALIELAEGILDCDRLYVCVEKDMRGVNSLVHSLIYVGFSTRTVLNKDNSKYLLLEYETE